MIYTVDRAIHLLNNWGQAGISQRHHWFPCEMTSERNKCRNCVLMMRHYPDLGSAFDWPCLHGKFASANAKHYPDLGSAFDWPCLRGKFASANAKDYPDLGSAFDWPCLRGKFASANEKHLPRSPVWNFCTALSEVISWGNQYWHRECLVFSQASHQV